VTFAVPNRAAVDRFYAAAVGAGRRDNGKPGLRPNYHPYYYGAFVLDPDGHNIEAVCRHPADGQFATELGERHILQAFDPSVV
jgi:predicted lactoylglutathione lyase